MSFKDFVKAVSEIPDYESDFHFRSQYDFIIDKKGKVLVDFLLHYESLAEDYATLSNNLNFNLPNLPHLNTSSSKPYYQFYEDRELINLVSKRYAKDIDNFGYSFK